MGCPNLLDENILQEFLELKSIVGERLAYLIYDKRNSFFRTNENGLINEEFIERNKSFSNQRDTILSMAIEELENIDSAYIEKIKDSLNEIDVNTNTKENIKPGVSELFESNPELANEVYEALGFGQERSLPTSSETINIYAGDNQNAELSNFAIRPFTTNVETPSGEKQYTFQSVEQGFHFYKALVANNPQIAKQILATTNGGQLKKLTNRSNLPMTSEQVKEWDDTSKSIMLNLMYDSYAQNPKAAEKLLSTGNAKITHTQDNTRWKTDFPEVVMTVRDMLKEEGFGKESNNISTFTNYSGAAQGGDTIWENIGKEFGLGKQVNYRPKDLKKLTKEQLKEVEDAYQQAVKDLGRRPLDVNTFAGGLVRRDYLQAKAADAVFAISTIVEPGQKDSKGYINKTNKSLVAGGTGYAVQMAINLGKPVYVFDQNKNQWFVWEIANLEKDGIEYEDFVPTGVPTLTTKFAGIGTRELNENGKQAIRNVYEKTTQSQITPQQKQEAQQLYSSYLQTTNNPTIEGFKQWNNRQQQINELFDSNPELANSVYEALGFKARSVNFKVHTSKTLNTFLEPFFNSGDESIVEPFAKNLTNEDKKILAKSVGRNYKDINQFDWYEALWSDVGQEEVFYYLKTANFLEQDVQKEKLNSKLYKEWQGFVKENKEFVDAYHKLPEKIQKEQQKDFNKLKAKNEWYQFELGNLEYDIRKKLLKDEGYIENNINLNAQITPEQKQQAQIKFQEYINATGRQDIEGFKDFVQGKQSITPRKGISELFSENPQLASIGTPEQYERYLSTIFPDSKVRDIVYHGSENKQQILEEGFKNNSELYEPDDDRAYESGELGYGYYFTTTQQSAKSYGEPIAVVLNNPDITNETTFNLITNEKGIQHFVKTKEQIHILGSKQNTEGFKEFVRGKHNSVIQLVDKRDLIPNSSAQLEIDFGQNYNAKNIQKTHNLFLEDKGFITTEEYEKLPYKDNGLTKTFYANSESDADYWVSKYGAIKVKLFGKDVGKYKMVIKKPFEIDDLPSSVEKLPKEIEETINRKKNVIQALKLKISKDNSRTNELKSKINLLNSRINKIKEKYKSDDFKLYEIAYEDVKLISENLKSFEKNLENSNLTSNELRIIVYKLVEVSYDIKGWIDVHNLVSEKYFGTEKDIANITGAIKMLDSKYKKILTNVFVRFAKLNTIYTELSEEDLIKAVADISIYNANVHTIGKSDIKLLKIVDDLLNNTATDINLEYQNKKIIINNQLKKAIDKLKISRNDLKEFFKQKRSDGIWTGDIIGEFKQEFYDKQSELIEEAKISKNWRKYFKWLNENSTSFTSKELVKISKMDEESITEIGRFSKKEVLQQKKLINDYRSFYMASVELLGKLDKYIDGELIINENESNEGISVEFKHDDAKIVDNFYYEIDSIIKENSPFEYLSNKEKKVNSKIKNIGYYYIIRNKPNENWEDLRFKEIKENETLMETYNMIMNTLDENNKYLPILNEYQSNYMPELAKPLLQRISNNGLIGMFGGLKNEIINSITEEVNSSEEMRPIIGSQTLEPIPIKMMSNNIITENKEDDIFKVLIEHSKMAISYKYKSQIEPLANASLDLIDFINEVSLKTTKAGSEYVTKFGKIKEREGGLVNAKKALKFRIESFLNNKSKDVEGVTKIKKKVKNLKGEVVEKNISLSKILDFLLGITYAKQLGAPNAISPTVNLAYGLVSNLSYAAGGAYVSEKNIIKSFIDLHSIAIGVNSKSEKTEKILTFIDSFGIFGNLYDTEVGDNGFIQKITFLQQKAELINQGSLVLAILKTIKLKDKNGNDISIYDAYTMDNGHLKWDTTKMEVQELLGNDVVYNKEKTQINFKTLSSFINDIVEEIHGDYKNPMMIKKTVLMRAVMQYKRFIPNAVKHRFGKEYENMNLIDEKTGKRGALVKGRYLSYINSKIFDKNLNQYIDAKFGDIVKILISGLLFNKKNIQQLKEIDRINMMRNIRELHFILLSMAAIMALESLINDDDDNDFMVKILINSISKTQSDMMFFLNPSAMSQITNNFIPVLSTIKDMQNLVHSSFKMLYGDIYYENGPWKDYSRLGVSTMKLFPGTNGAVKMFNYGSRVFEFN